MCGVIGFTTNLLRGSSLEELAEICVNSTERGRDGWGYFVRSVKDNSVSILSRRYNSESSPLSIDSLVREFLDWDLLGYPIVFIANTRGMPTSEYGLEPKLGHPFISPDNRWYVTHNGTIANDKDILGANSTEIDTQAFATLLADYPWEEAVSKVVGSFCFLGIDTQDTTPQIHYATNYKPLWADNSPQGLFLASQEKYLPGKAYPVPSYTSGTFSPIGPTSVHRLLPRKIKPKVLVVCSGGLDSATVAWKYHVEGLEVHLLHIRYHCKAEGREVEAIKKLANSMNCQYHIIETNFFLQHADSSLTNDTRSINKSRDGIGGAELATEWVPARNLVMMALATAYAEANDFDIIALGINQEESGAFPDNEQEMINRMNFLRPFVVKPNLELKYEAPVGHMMKHEIVKLGLDLKLPYEHTWSCYEGGERPCGKCGPCFMRQKAFEINSSVDPLLEI